MRSVGNLIDPFVCTSKPFGISRWKAVCRIEEAWRFRLANVFSERRKLLSRIVYIILLRQNGDLLPVLYIYIMGIYVCMYVCMYMQ